MQCNMWTRNENFKVDSSQLVDLLILEVTGHSMFSVVILGMSVQLPRHTCVAFILCRGAFVVWSSAPGLWSQTALVTCHHSVQKRWVQSKKMRMSP